MIRYFNSFFISICIHFILFILAFFLLKNSIFLEKEIIEKKTSLTLSHLIIKKNELMIEKKRIKKKESKNHKKIIKKNKRKTQIKRKKETTKNIIKKNIKETKKKLENKQVKIVQASSIKKEKQFLEEKKIALKIRQMIEENKYYPKKARRRGIEGIVNVEFTLTKTGKVISLKVISSHKVFIKSLKETINNISNDFPKPKSDLTVRIAINFSLKR